ncbi:SDR family NAD(P)-dependent oxidoreductase [Parapedomonas caeni]
MGLLTGKVAVVTGGGGGLGRAYALLFAREGARVVVNDYGGNRDGTGAGTAPAAEKVVEEIRAAGGEAVANAADVRTMAGGESILETALAAFGRVDILVNNAGILRDKTLLKTEEEDWDQVIAVHLKGAFCVTKPIFAWMKDNGGGVIVNTTSTSGIIGNFGQSNYAAAKAGLWGLSHVLALEGMRYGIRVWAFAPTAATRMTEGLIPPEIAEKWTPDRLAPVVLYMVSDLSKQHTGKTLTATGTNVMELKLVSGAGFATGAEPFTAESIAAHEDEIYAPEGSIHFLR